MQTATQHLSSFNDFLWTTLLEHGRVFASAASRADGSPASEMSWRSEKESDFPAQSAYAAMFRNVKVFGALLAGGCYLWLSVGLRRPDSGGHTSLELCRILVLTEHMLTNVGGLN